MATKYSPERFKYHPSYKHKCIECHQDYKQLTRHQYHCIACLHAKGPDLKIDKGDFHIELYTELVPYKNLRRLMTLVNRKEVKDDIIHK